MRAAPAARVDFPHRRPEFHVSLNVLNRQCMTLSWPHMWPPPATRDLQDMLHFMGSRG
jgi:hypothetical protein